MKPCQPFSSKAPLQHSVISSGKDMGNITDKRLFVELHMKNPAFNGRVHTLRQHNIGFPGQSFIVEPVPEAVGMQEAPHHHLGLRVLVANPAHVLAAGGFVVDVCHYVRMRRCFVCHAKIGFFVQLSSRPTNLLLSGETRRNGAAPAPKPCFLS
jgi:hypothetical protein